MFLIILAVIVLVFSIYHYIMSLLYMIDRVKGVNTYTIAVLLLANNMLLLYSLLNHSCEATCILDPETLTPQPIAIPKTPEATTYAVASIGVNALTLATIFVKDHFLRTENNNGDTG